MAEESREIWLVRFADRELEDSWRQIPDDLVEAFRDSRTGYEIRRFAPVPVSEPSNV